MTNSIYILSKTKTKICSAILEKTEISYSDYKLTKSILYNHIHLDNLSPKQIKEKYKISFVKNFSDSIKYHFNIKLKSKKESVINYFNKNNKSITDEKLIYWKNCKFTFDIYNEPNIKGFDLIKIFNFAKSKNDNLHNTIHRDHMISIKYGFENNIPPEHISHPANCEILLSIDNITKNSNCSITYNQLLDRIINWNNNSELKELKQTILKSPKTEEHKKNLSKSITEWHKNRTKLYSLEILEELINSSSIEEDANSLNLSKKQLSDKIRYLRKISN